MGIFSTGKKKSSFTGFSGTGPDTDGEKGACIGLIFPKESSPP
jgi:hypothetical protein